MPVPGAGAEKDDEKKKRREGPRVMFQVQALSKPKRWIVQSGLRLSLLMSPAIVPYGKQASSLGTLWREWEWEWEKRGVEGRFSEFAGVGQRANRVGVEQTATESLNNAPLLRTVCRDNVKD